MIISYCSRCGRRNDVSVWPAPPVNANREFCTCLPEPPVTILPPSGSTVIQYDLVTEDRLREMVRTMVAEALAPLPTDVEMNDVLKLGDEVTLEDLRPGAIFVTRAGCYAVKSEYRYSSNPLAQCECVLLASGEYAHFEDGNQTLVREVRIGE